MKRILAVFITLFMLVSCSLQEKVSSEILTERLCKTDNNILPDSDLCFHQGDRSVFYFTYAELLFFVAELYSDGQGNIKQINLACDKTDKIDLFVQCVKSFENVYVPDENSDEINAVLFKEKKISGNFLFYETQWYLYSAVLSENGFYFSIENKKLSPQTAVELSLKPNDIVEY